MKLTYTVEMDEEEDTYTYLIALRETFNKVVALSQYNYLHSANTDSRVD